MIVLSPCDAIEARKATIEAAKTGTPVYIRLAREKTPIITTDKTPFEIGKAQIFYECKKPEAVIIATGALVHKAMQVAEKLGNVIVINLPTIKPLDEKTILDVAKRAGAIVTVEEHQVHGGMGSAVSELLAENYPVPIEFIGVKDQFGQSGTPDELIEHYGLGEKSIEEAVKKVVARK
jgi:transketolase